LDHYNGVLAKLGIDVRIWRSDGSKVTLTRRSDDPSTQSSAEPSGGNVITSNRLQPSDAKTECLARLRAKKASPQQNEEIRS
jgi:hypothetical protein